MFCSPVSMPILSTVYLHSIEWHDLGFVILEAYNVNAIASKEMKKKTKREKIILGSPTLPLPKYQINMDHMLGD